MVRTGKRRIKASMNASEGYEIKWVSPDALKPNPRNARTHSKKQIRQIADSIVAYGFTVPLLVDESLMILAGHGRLEAAKLARPQRGAGDRARRAERGKEARTALGR